MVFMVRDAHTGIEFKLILTNGYHALCKLGFDLAKSALSKPCCPLVFVSNEFAIFVNDYNQSGNLFLKCCGIKMLE